MVSTVSSTRNTDERVEQRADWVLIAFGLWTIVGLFLDGWAHSERRPDGFFTPWHAVLYSGGAGMAAVTAWRARREHPESGWIELLRRADRPSVVGLGLFGLGGLGDMIWHQVFGIELNLEAVLSPTHLTLMTGGLLVMSAPLRRAWRRPAPDRLGPFTPVLVSLALISGVAFFFTFFASPFGQTVVPSLPSVAEHVHDFSQATPSRFAQIREMWALTGMLLTTVLTVAPAVVLAHRWKLPRGSFVVLFGFCALTTQSASEFSDPSAALAMLAAGVTAEMPYVRRVALPVFGGLTAAAVWLAYFAAVAVFDGIGWSAELWTGIVVLCAGLGAALGFAVSATRLSTQDTPERGPRVAARPA